MTDNKLEATPQNNSPRSVIARLLGHSKTETTEQRYVKYRDSMMDEAKMYIYTKEKMCQLTQN